MSRLLIRYIASSLYSGTTVFVMLSVQDQKARGAGVTERWSGLNGSEVFLAELWSGSRNHGTGGAQRAGETREK